MYRDDLKKIDVRNVKANMAAMRRAAQDGAKRSVCGVMRKISPFKAYSSTMIQSGEAENSVSQVLAFLQEQDEMMKSQYDFVMKSSRQESFQTVIEP